MGFKANVTKGEITLDGKSDLVKGTKYEGEEFLLTLKYGFEEEMDTAALASSEVKRKVGSDSDDFTMMFNLYALNKWKPICAIKEWYGFEDEDGEQLDCTSENILMFFEDSDYRDLFDIIGKALNQDNRTDSEIEVDEASGEPSSGSDGSTDPLLEEPV